MPPAAAHKPPTSASAVRRRKHHNSNGGLQVEAEASSHSWGGSAHAAGALHGNEAHGSAHAAFEDTPQESSEATSSDEFPGPTSASAGGGDRAADGLHAETAGLQSRKCREPSLSTQSASFARDTSEACHTTFTVHGHSASYEVLARARSDLYESCSPQRTQMPPSEAPGSGRYDTRT